LDRRQDPAGERGPHPVLDHGFLFGDGVFEGIRVTPRGIFRFADHMKRLETGRPRDRLVVPGGFERVTRSRARRPAPGAPREGYLRLVVTRGVGALGIDPSTCPEPAIVCIATGAAPLSPEKAARGLDLITSSLRRPSADVLDPRVKSLNYLNNVLAKREATVRGADDALVLNARGLVAEVVGDERLRAHRRDPRHAPDDRRRARGADPADRDGARSGARPHRPRAGASDASISTRRTRSS
jgi:branched-subunit amino acid aminotransferase/4-amino-4-deoxychorismate lyase